MTGHEKRTAAKKRMIQRSALELFDKYGFEKVTLDEISRKAGVSRVTIYKHFRDKENLHVVVLRDLARQTVERIEDIVQTDLPFHAKLRKILLLKRGISILTDNQFIESTIDPDGELGGVITPELSGRIAVLMQRFVAQGRSEGLIHPDLTDEVVNTYFKLIRAGVKQLQDSDDPLIHDLETLGDLVSISLNGLRHSISDDV